MKREISLRSTRIAWLYNLFGLNGGGSGGGGGQGSTTWELVTNGTSPFNANGFVRFRCNATAGPCTIVLNTEMLQGARIYVSVIAGANPVIIEPTFITPPNVRAPTIQDPSQAGGTLFNATAVLTTGQGAIGSWEYDAADNLLIQVA